MKQHNNQNAQLLELAFQISRPYISGEQDIARDGGSGVVETIDFGLDLGRLLLALLAVFPDEGELTEQAEKLLALLHSRFGSLCAPPHSGGGQCALLGVRLSQLYLQLSHHTCDDRHSDTAVELAESCFGRFSAEKATFQLPITDLAQMLCVSMQLHAASGSRRLLKHIDLLLKVLVNNIRANARHFQFHSMPKGQLGLNGLSGVPPALALHFAHAAAYLDNRAYYALSRSIYPFPFKPLPEGGEGEVYRSVCADVYGAYANSIMKHYPDLPAFMLFEQAEWLLAANLALGGEKYAQMAGSLLGRYENAANSTPAQVVNAAYLRLLANNGLRPFALPDFAGFEPALVTDADTYPYITVFEEELKNRFLKQIFPETVRCLNDAGAGLLVDFLMEDWNEHPAAAFERFLDNVSPFLESGTQARLVQCLKAEKERNGVDVT